jgi:threonine dehydratase
MGPIQPVSLQEIRDARVRIAGAALRSPLLPLQVEGAPAEIWLKLENLQPVRSFKLRGAVNAMELAGASALSQGVYTASAGNMGQGVAWNARRLGVPCRVIVPEGTPRVKIEAIERFGAEPIRRPYDEWWRVLADHGHPGERGRFVHPVSDPAVIAGNGTIGLEIVEDLPDVAAVVVPFGGGGLSCGIAAAVRALRPAARVWAAEVETGAPLEASLAAGRPVTVPYRPSFVDGIGGKGLLEEMWPQVRQLLDGSLVVGLREVAEAVRLLALRNGVIAEGAGAVPVAAALAGRAGGGKVVCVVSGGNIDTERLTAILEDPGRATGAPGLD